MKTQWDDIARPTLEYLLLSEPNKPSSHQIARTLEIDHEVLWLQIESLREEGYIATTDGGDINGPAAFTVRLCARARRVLGEWPGDPADEFLRIVERELASAESADAKERWTRLKEGAQGVSKTTLSAVLQGVVQGAMS